RAFRPPPRVWSAVVALRTRAMPAFAPLEQNAFLRFVSDVFRHRRKQLRGALGHEAGVERDRAERALATANIDPRRRPEELALASATGHEPHAFVRIRKRIPIAAGLGGGSSDAAAVLRGLASLWKVDADLLKVAAEVGSDVPFFAGGFPVALVSGRGEHVKPLRTPSDPLFA